MDPRLRAVEGGFLWGSVGPDFRKTEEKAVAGSRVACDVAQRAPRKLARAWSSGAVAIQLPAQDALQCSGDIATAAKSKSGRMKHEHEALTLIFTPTCAHSHPKPWNPVCLVRWPNALVANQFACRMPPSCRPCLPLVLLQHQRIFLYVLRRIEVLIAKPSSAHDHFLELNPPRFGC